MVQIINNTQEALLGQEDAPIYDTTGSWYAWMTGSKASLECKDRPLVWAVQRNTSLTGYEARDTVAAALKGDVAAQRKVQVALDTGNTADSSSSGRCSRGPSPEMKAKMRDMVQLLAQGQLTQLETARTEFRAEMKAKWEQHRSSNSGGCGSRCGGASCNKSSNSGSETDKHEAPLQGSLSKDDETLKSESVNAQM